MPEPLENVLDLRMNTQARTSRSHTRNRHRMWCKACNRKKLRLRSAGETLKASLINCRFTIKRHPDLYKHWPKCPHCGSLDTVSAEKARRAEMDRYKAAGKLCSCLPFLHKRGEILGCAHGPDVTDENWQDVEAMLATPRGGGK